MKRTILSALFLFAFASASAPFASAQEDQGDVGQVHFVKPKAGETLQWEVAYKKHVAWHRSKNDTWSWPVWEIITGERAGQYAISTFFHHWKDLDRELGAEDNAHAREYLDRYTESATMEVWRYRPGVSNPPKDGATPAYAGVYYRHLNQGMMGAYTGAVRKINDAIVKADWGVGYYRNVYVNSGDEPMAVRWVARRTWEDFAPPALSFPRMLEDLNVAPLAHAATALVTSARVANVDTVMMDGRIRKRGGQLVGIDSSEIVERASRSLHNVLTRAGGEWTPEEGI